MTNNNEKTSPKKTFWNRKRIAIAIISSVSVAVVAAAVITTAVLFPPVAAVVGTVGVLAGIAATAAFVDIGCTALKHGYKTGLKNRGKRKIGVLETPKNESYQGEDKGEDFTNIANVKETELTTNKYEMPKGLTTNKYEMPEGLTTNKYKMPKELTTNKYKVDNNNVGLNSSFADLNVVNLDLDNSQASKLSIKQEPNKTSQQTSSARYAVQQTLPEIQI